MTFLHWIKSHLIINIFVAMGLGLVVGYYLDVAWMKQTILPLTFLLVYPMMVTLNLQSVMQKFNWTVQFVAVIINFIVFPLIAYSVGMLFFEDEPYFRLGLLLIALLPTSGMTISWTMMAKGNVAEAIRLIVFGLLLGAIVSPIYISGLLGESIHVPFWNIVSNILMVVFVPLVAAYLTQIVLKKKYGEEKFHQTIKKHFPPFSTLGVVLIIIVAIALKAKVIISNPEMLLQIVIPLILLYALFMIVSLVIGRLFLSREDAIALINGTVIRNLSLALAITLGAFEQAGIAALLIAIAYALQVQIAAWTVKLSTKIFPHQSPDIVAIKNKIIES